MADFHFIPGQTYKRSAIHDQFGGTRQGGIAPSATFPYIFIFSSPSGNSHGYTDRWENEDVFSYSGEGQKGDMKFTRGNLAVLEHRKQGKRVLLFLETKRSFVRYQGELELLEFNYFRAPDKNNDEREAIKFFFRRAGRILPYEQARHLDYLLSKVCLFSNLPNETERKGLVTSRVGQGAYRKSILYRWKFSCAVSGYSQNEVLIASHIVPWRDSSNEERLDVNNGILLSPTYDALFDRHLISFENDGKIIFSEKLSKTNYKALGVTGREIIKDLSEYNKAYLERHRELLSQHE